MNPRDKKLREQKVLEIVIQTYILTAMPVSSRYVSRKLDLSSATIRNVMADLEDMGLISHPHISAGRIPTDKGYRYYVDSLMCLKRITDRQIEEIELEYRSKLQSLEDIFEETTHILSRFTNCAGATLLPGDRELKTRIYLGGTRHILEYPEFRDYRKLINILEFFEEKKTISSILTNDLYEKGLKVHIGSENRPFGLDEFSIITSGFKMKDQSAGRLGVIGPLRMNYERIIPVVEVLSDTVTRVLSYWD